MEYSRGETDLLPLSTISDEVFNRQLQESKCQQMRQLGHTKSMSQLNLSSQLPQVPFEEIPQQQSLQQQQMMGSINLFEKNIMNSSTISQKQKLPKNLILFSNQSGITLGDLEKIKIDDMQNIKNQELIHSITLIIQDQIIKEELGGDVDDQKLKEIMKNQAAQQKLSVKLKYTSILHIEADQDDDVDDGNCDEDNNKKDINVSIISHKDKQIDENCSQIGDQFAEIQMNQLQNQNIEQAADQKSQNHNTDSNGNDKKSPISSENELEEDDEIIQSAEGAIQNIPTTNIEQAGVRMEMVSIQLAPLVEMKGFLKKRSPKFLVGWQKRWCVLKDNKFFYSKNENSIRPLGCISFNIISTKAELIVGKKSKRKKMLLKFNNIGKQFTFKSSDPNQSIEMWYEQVNNHIKQSIGFTSNLTLSTRKFWRDDRISTEQFAQMADTGDLILFKGKSFLSRLQRAFTGSEFDHVAIVLKYSTTDIFLMEALGGKIVITEKKMIKEMIVFACHREKSYCLGGIYSKRINVFRKLNLERSYLTLSRIESFIQFALNKKYKFTLGKILRKKTSQKEESDSNDKRTFFCSELVAAVYKKIEILNDDTACSAYLPGHFSQEKQLKFENGASLSSELLVDFEMI